jgi:hypothetical protein
MSHAPNIIAKMCWFMRWILLTLMIAIVVSKCQDGQRKNFLSEGLGVGLQKPTNYHEVWMLPFYVDVVIWIISH